VKEFFSHRGVAFGEINIREDEPAMRRLVDWGFRSTPVTVIGEERIAGFDRARLLRALGEPDAASR
jgi:hypothetical protein